MKCEGQAHHWIAVITGYGVPVFACRHCDETEEFDVHCGFDREELGPCMTDAEVRVVSYTGSAPVIGDRWRSCIWCRENIPAGRDGSTCGREGCQQRESAWVEAHPDSGGREQVEIVNGLYF